MSFTIEELLTLVKLDEYLDLFKINGINDIKIISDSLLKDLGIAKIGHRRRILIELENLFGTKYIPNLDDVKLGDGDTQDFPPPLPPKSKAALGAPDTVAVPKSPPHTKPQKPPRVNIGGKPVAPKVNQAPPIPPRVDLLDELDRKANILRNRSFNYKAYESIEVKDDSVTALRSGSFRNEELSSKLENDKNNNKKSSFSKTRPMSMLPDISNLSVDPSNDSYLLGRKISPMNKANDSKSLPFQKIFTPNKSNHTKSLPSYAKREPPSEKFVLPKWTDYQSEDDLSGDEGFARQDEDDEDGSAVSTKYVSAMKDKEEFINLFADKSSDVKSTVDDMKFNLNRKSTLCLPTSGYLYKRGGVTGEKRITKRWIEFDGNELKYFKEKGGEAKKTIPVSRMKDVLLEPNAKKPTFHLVTTNRTFTFIEGNGKQKNLSFWVNILMISILSKGDEEDDSDGNGSNPDKEGFLLKEGHNILHDIKKRYVVIKDGKLWYYENHQDYLDGLYISYLDMKLVSLKTEDDKLKLILNTHTCKTYVFSAEDLDSYNSWKEAIRMSIQYGIGDNMIRDKIQENPSNTKCADCNHSNPVYASINLLVVVCAECIGIHRLMGAEISKSRSLLMDECVWTDPLIKLFQTIGNDRANSLWECKMPIDDKITPQTSSDERLEFICKKYKDRRYFDWSPLYGEPTNLGMELRWIVSTNNVLETLRLLISQVDVYYVPEDSEDDRTCYEIARDAGMDMQVELLTQYNGHLTKEERQAKQEALEYQEKLGAQELENEKSGLLLVRTTRSDTVKEKMATLNGRKLEMKRADRGDECETIDLSQVEELEIDKDDGVTLTVRLPGKTYFLKAFFPEDADSWYQAMHNKQVMGVPLECQDCTDKKIPYLISECIAYMEQHALLTEGLYRHSGVKSTIQRLQLMFNQDAANVRLKLEDFPDVHAVAGLIKLYLRQLPDPILTGKLYEEFISNAADVTSDEEHQEKLYAYKSLLEKLPPVNYSTLRFIILHLNQVASLSESNKMEHKAIIVLFGPILLSGGRTLDQAWLCREYQVISDLLTYYIWLFDVTDGELKMLKGMVDFLHTIVQQPTVAEFTMVTIFVEENEDQMKMTDTTKPCDVCLYGVQKYNLPVSENWGLFEVMTDGCLERLVHSSEEVLMLAARLGAKGRLVVKPNYIVDLISTYQATSLCVTGYLNYYKDKWKKNCYIEVKTGNIRIYAKKGNSKEEDNISIHGTELFIGTDPKKKAPAKFGFRLSKAREGEFRYFCSDNEMEVNKFIANILLVRYPIGVYTPGKRTTVADAIGDDPALSGGSPDRTFWGRQSAIVRPKGTSIRFLEQLEKKRSTLKNIFSR